MQNSGQTTVVLFGNALDPRGRTNHPQPASPRPHGKPVAPVLAKNQPVWRSRPSKTLVTGRTRHDGKRIRNRTAIFGALSLMIVAVAAAFYWYRAEEPGPAKGPRAANRAGAPVTVAVASRQDVPIYLTGIGSVQAYFTIDIRAKDDGELQEEVFTEGQRVKKGDVP